jgi:hypothetical protein
MLPSQPPAPAAKKRGPMIIALLCLFTFPAIILGILFFEHRGGSADDRLKEDLVRAIHDQQGIDVEMLTLTLNASVGPRPGKGYSGSVRFKSTGQTAPVEVWLEPFFNAKGESAMMHWTLKMPSPPATQPTPVP